LHPRWSCQLHQAEGLRFGAIVVPLVPDESNDLSKVKNTVGGFYHSFTGTV
jgi:hypothetical protein